MSIRSGPTRVCRWEPTELVSTLLSAGAREVVRQWISSASYLDDHHDPVLLTMAADSDNAFTRLVRQANGELAPTVILNELLRKGIVEQHLNGHLLLRRSAYALSRPRLQNSIRVDRGLRNAPLIRRRRYNDFG